MMKEVNENMEARKYENLVKSVPFQFYEHGGLRQGTELTKEFHGFDVNVKYGAYWLAGRMGNEPYIPHIHDYDQVLLLAGSDMDDIGELGAEVELCLGENMETHMITTTTAIAIPRGIPHFPATVNRLDRRFLYMEISLTAECKETIVTTDKKPGDIAVRRSKTRKYVMPVQFARKGAWFYGKENRDDGGGYISSIRTHDVGFDFFLLYESMKKGPYRIGSEPDKPHTHPHTQIMLFLGTNTDDLSDLGADFEICMGEEQEKYAFNKSTAVMTPPFLPHWPGGVVRLNRPMLMADIHPFDDEPGRGKAFKVKYL
jgi:hypothetical protein